MLIDMKRVIAEHSKEVEIKNSKKFKLIMEEKKFRLFINLQKMMKLKIFIKNAQIIMKYC